MRPSRITIGWPSEQTSSVSSVVKSLRRNSRRFSSTRSRNGAVEGAQQRHPRPLAARDLVELLLHAGRELEVHVVAEVLDEQVRHDLADELRVQPALLDADVAPVLIVEIVAA